MLERMAPVLVRLAGALEVGRIRELEDLAGERYGEVDIDPDLPGLEEAVIATAQAEGLLWVAAEEDEPVGFALCWIRPGAMHLREIDVHPSRMGRGHGRRLVEHVVEQARRRGLPRVTLTTFRDVPWNAPLYRHLGFSDLDASQMPVWLGRIREEEDATELRRWPRVAMARDV